MRRQGTWVGIAGAVAVVVTLVISGAAPDHRVPRALPVVADRLASVDATGAGGDRSTDRDSRRLDELAVAAGDRVIPPPPARFDGSPARRGALPDALQRFTDGERRPGGGVWAVIVGIDDYPGTRNDLRSAVNDADDIDRALERFGVPADRRVVLRDGAASASTIEIALDWLVTNANADATAVFFFAGHARRPSSTRHTIVTANGTTMSDVALRDRLVDLRATKAWIAIAACYGGGFDELVAPGRILTAASDANHLAYENESFGNSYLVEYMVQRAMIDGAADTSVQAAFDHAKTALDREHPGRTPFELDAAMGPIDLRQDVDQAEHGPPSSTSTSPAEAQPAPAPEDETQNDTCARLTLGVVRCRD